jgi:hypothetical protein
LREARAWFVAEFNPQTFAEFVALVSTVSSSARKAGLKTRLYERSNRDRRLT